MPVTAIFQHTLRGEEVQTSPLPLPVADLQDQPSSAPWWQVAPIHGISKYIALSFPCFLLPIFPSFPALVKALGSVTRAGKGKDGEEKTGERESDIF